MTIIIYLLQVIWYALPFYMANNAPVFANLIFRKRFSTPVDFNIKFFGRPLFGKNKTIRGIIAGAVMGIFIVSMQVWLYRYDSFRIISIINYNEINLLLLGFLMGFGALFGDLLKSFIKRRMNIKPGESWKPWDQIDFIIGGIFFSSFVYIPPAGIILGSLVIIPAIKIILDHVGYYLGICKKW